jgi:YD repeat-containing protein
MGEVDFNYVFDRKDQLQEARLASVKLLSNIPIYGTLLKTYSFNTSYFGIPSTDPNVLRLRLDSISVSGNTPAAATALTLKSFSYNSANLPSRKMMEGYDFWGYFNRLPDVFPYNLRTPSPTAALACILTSVHDLSGSTYQLFYELNDYYDGSTNVQVGGLRVSKIMLTLPSNDHISTTYSYLQNGHSSGQILTTSYDVVGFTGAALNQPLITVHTFTDVPSQVYDLNGNFSGYSAVRVTNQNGGYTTYQFSNFGDPGCNDIFQFLYINQAYVPVVTSTVSKAYKRGLLLNKAIFNASGKKISEDLLPMSSYTALTTTATERAVAYKWNYYTGSVHGYTGYAQCNSFYYTNVEDLRLTKSIHRDYDQLDTSRYVETINYLTYDANKRLIKSDSTIDSKGHANVKTIYYTADASIPMLTTSEQSAVTSMYYDNVTSVPIHTIYKKNGTILQTHNAYKLVWDGGANTYNYLVNTDSYTGGTLQTQQFFTYDSTTSNLIATNMSGGKTTAYKYGYNAALPVLAATNALPSEIYYEGFEAQRVDTNYSVGHAHNGLFYYKANYTVNFIKPNTKNYVIQWWSYSLGTWTFHEQAYTGSITLTGPVDDIRIFPTDAAVVSTNYEPFIGKTFELDQTGKTITYEYDGYGRPSATRDNDGNLVQEMCYSYPGKALSCPPSTYTSRQLTKAFTRNDCSPQLGRTVLYNVPSGQYTATSQQEANQLAQDDINANGQAYANSTGDCYYEYTDTYFYNFTDYTVLLSFQIDGQSFYFFLDPNSSSSASLPIGDYSLSVSCSYDVMCEAGCGEDNSGSGSNFSISDFQISETCNSVYIDPYSELRSTTPGKSIKKRSIPEKK